MRQISLGSPEIFAAALLSQAVAGQVIALSNEEKSAFASIFTEPQSIAAGVNLITEEETRPEVHGIEDGWLACYKTLSDGQRQVIQFQIAGDLLGLRDLLSSRASHSVVALTPVRLRSAQADDFMQLLASYPRLAAAVVWLLGHEEALLVDHLVGLGQERTLKRAAGFFYDIMWRLRNVGLANQGEFTFPVPNPVLGDALGISEVHMSRTLGKLRELGLLEVRNRKVRILSEEALAAFVEPTAARLRSRHPGA